MWWHTLINQSGLSIIFTTIILLITITVGYITKQQFNDTFDRKLKEFNSNVTNVINDIINIFYYHKGEEGAIMHSQISILDGYIQRLNSFSNLKTLNKNDFKKLYNEDLKEIAVNIINGSNCHNSDEIGADIKTHFNKIESLDDKEMVIDIIKKIFNEPENKDKKGFKKLLELLKS